MISKIGTFKDYSDGTLKTVFDVGNNKIIEMSLLFNKEDKDVVCVPTHHFCNLGCKMCHLTNRGFNKVMTPIKWEDFIYCLINTLSINGKRRTDKENLLISFMGVGEPLLNLKLIEDVYRNEDLIKEELGYKNIGYALATMMPNDNIIKLGQMVNNLDMPLKVHFSLHNPIDVKRYELIPSTKVSVQDALAYLVSYRNLLQRNKVLMNKYVKLHSNNDPIEIHYTLINGVNDDIEELDRMCKLLDRYNITIKFIRFNPINELEISKNEQLWVRDISNRVPNIRIKTYSPPGREVGSSCGEFTKHFYHMEIESAADGHSGSRRHPPDSADDFSERADLRDHEFRGQFPSGGFEPLLQQCAPYAVSENTGAEDADSCPGDHGSDPGDRNGSRVESPKHLCADDQLLGVPAGDRLHSGGHGDVFSEIDEAVGTLDHGKCDGGLARLHAPDRTEHRRRIHRCDGFRRIPVRPHQRSRLRIRCRNRGIRDCLCL